MGAVRRRLAAGLAFLAVWLPGASARAGQTPLLVADVGALTGDEQLLLASLQGLANRPGPRVYLVGVRDGQDFDVDPTAERWLADAVPLPTERVSPWELVARLAPEVRGTVVWDPALPVDTQNLATTIAGLEDALPASPELAERLGGPPSHLPVLYDLRELGFRTGTEVYLWALEHLPLDRFGHLAWLGGARNGRPGSHGLRDWIVARRGFAFEADPTTDAALVTRILQAFPPGMQVFGYPHFDDEVYRRTGQATGEPQGVGEISRSGKVLVPSTDAVNLTVHAAFPPVRQSPPWDDTPRLPDPGKTYVTFLITDGDNLGYNEQALRARHWEDPARGSVPMGVSVSPLLAVYAPRLYDYYVRTLSPGDVLVAGPSGAGYVYPSQMPNLDDYLATTRQAMELSGLRVPWILDNGYLWSPPPTTVRRYVEALAPPAVFTDYGGWVVPNPPAVSWEGEVPVVHMVWGENPAFTMARIRLAAAAFPRGPGFVAVALATWTMGYTQARQVAEGLGPPFAVVRPDQFVGLLRGARTP